MKTHRNLTVAAVVAILSYGVGAFMTLPASQGATPRFVPAPKTASAPQADTRIQQELQQELQQRIRARALNVAKIHHEFALKDAEIRRMHAVIAHKDSIIHQLRSMLGMPVNGG